MTKSETCQPPTVHAAVAIVLSEASYNTISRAIATPNTPPHTPDPQLLITKRPPTTVYGGYWEFPGGKLDPGETPTQAAIREAREELGIHIATLAELPPITHTYEHATVHLHPILARLAPTSPPPRNLEVADHRWCTVSDIPWDHFLPANVRIITRLLRHLTTPPIQMQSNPTPRRSTC